MTKQQRLEAKIAELKAQLSEQKRKAEKLRLHHQITIARSTILNTLTTEELKELASKVKQAPELLTTINEELKRLLNTSSK